MSETSRYTGCYPALRHLVGGSVLKSDAGQETADRHFPLCQRIVGVGVYMRADVGPSKGTQGVSERILVAPSVWKRIRPKYQVGLLTGQTGACGLY